MDDLGGGCSAATPYALRVLGDSMEPEFEDGNIIIVDPGTSAINGSFVVIDYDNDTTLRQFVIEGEQKILRALNKDYPDAVISGAYRVRGVVIQRSSGRRSSIKHYDY